MIFSIEQEVEIYTKRFRDYSDDQLYAVIYSKVPHCAEHIAAQRLIDMRKTEREEARHDEIQKKLEELKKPHRASFWLLVVSVTLAFVAAVAAILSLPQVQKSVFGNPQSQEKIEQLQPSGYKSQSPKPELPKK